MQDRHDGNEHLRADLRVELEVLLKIKLLDILEGLLDEGLDLALLNASLLLVHWGASMRTTVGASSVFSRAQANCGTALLLARLRIAGMTFRVLEWDVAQQDEHFLWADKIVTVEIEPKI